MVTIAFEQDSVTDLPLPPLPACAVCACSLVANTLIWLRVWSACCSPPCVQVAPLPKSKIPLRQKCQNGAPQTFRIMVFAEPKVCRHTHRLDLVDHIKKAPAVCDASLILPQWPSICIASTDTIVITPTRRLFRTLGTVCETRCTTHIS